eukprot:1323796-Lingulodinium_polyedra.AAC.1
MSPAACVSRGAAGGSSPAPCVCAGDEAGAANGRGAGAGGSRIKARTPSRLSTLVSGKFAAGSSPSAKRTHFFGSAYEISVRSRGATNTACCPSSGSMISSYRLRTSALSGRGSVDTMTTLQHGVVHNTS